MNCEDYREKIAADPASAAHDAHVASCSACCRFQSEMAQLDRRIGKALAIAVPELEMPELPDVTGDNVVPLPARRRFGVPAWIAIAATFVLAAFLGVRMFGTDIQYDSLAEEIIAHLDHEPYALRVTDVRVPERRLRSVVPANVAEFDQGSGLITYAQTCVINGRQIPHLVIQGERGPVTVLLLPEEKVRTAVELSGESIEGMILPVGSGSIAIIGEREERLEVIRDSVVRSITWST